LPARIFLPMGNGTLVLGTLQGLAYLNDSGMDTSGAQVVAVQAENCAPIARSYAAQQTVVAPVENLGTAATGIAIAAPKRGNQLLSRLVAQGGRIEVAAESEISTTQAVLAESGLVVETTTAATFCPILRESASNRVESVIPACGAGSQ
ncbi:MAG: pyridoxal-phosphate dependent enzyme, partial [Planctomycetota bacterium]